MSNRRNALLGLGVLSGLAAGVRGLFAGAPAEAAQTARAYEVAHTDAEWRKLLGNERYHVLRQAGTERPFSSPLDKEKRTGVFSCAGCALPLFSSKTKFESGTGWPSFWQPLDHAVDETVGLDVRHAAGGSAVPPLRRPPGPRVRRRAEADRPALLHEWPGAELHARLRLKVLICACRLRRNPYGAAL